MPFPDPKEVKRALKKLRERPGTHLLSKDATRSEQFRFDLCAVFIKYLHQNNLTQAQLAEQLGVDAGILSKILHYKVEKISTDYLLKQLDCLFPQNALTLKVTQKQQVR